MAVTINADTVTGAAVVTADGTGILALQAAGNTGLTLNSSRAVGVGASPSFGTAGQVLTSQGSAAAPIWGSAPSPTAANQTEMEAASSNTVFATPLNLKWHPGVAKAWLMCDSAGNINASFNIASITDVGTGEVTATYTTAFSSATYSMQWSSYGGNTLTFAKASSQATGTSGGTALLSNSGTASDPFRWFFVAHGDQ